jgi:hypothetical protein
MWKELTFDNLHNHLYDFTKIENSIIDVSGYDFVEPVGIAILKAIQQEIKDIKIRLYSSSRFYSYLKILTRLFMMKAKLTYL